MYSERQAPEHFSAHFPQWRRLALSTNQADPFCCTPAWQLSFHAAFAPSRGLIVREMGDSCIAFAENMLRGNEVLLTSVEAHWLFGCPLLGKDSVGLLAESIPMLEQHYGPRFPTIVISGLRPKGRTQNRLRRRFGDFFTVRSHVTSAQCAASLQGGVDGFLSRRSANHRRKLKKQARIAGDRGVWFERVLPRTSDEAAAVFDRIIAVERKSWKGIGKCGMAEQPTRGFYALLIEQLAYSGDARVIFARQEDEDIGFVFGAMAGRIYRGQQFSYAEAWRDYGIGNLLQMEQVGWLCEEGAKRYDMGPLTGPKMEYKAHWTEKTFPIEAWVMTKR